MAVPRIYKPVSKAISTAPLPGTEGCSAYTLSRSTSVSPAGLPRDNLRVIVLMIVTLLLPFLEPVKVVRAC